ncbi:hypothetical protein NW759_010399 [Fusarium solani]|nr:hypothetical protein NW759_010399 [Fusarium solani]
MARRQFLVFVKREPLSQDIRRQHVQVQCDIYSNTGERISHQSATRSLPVIPRALEQEISWAIQDYVKDPFQSHRAELAFNSFTDHGKYLEQKLDLPGFFRECEIKDLSDVDIQLNIVDSADTDSGGSFRSIPWEILESPDVSSIGSGTVVHVRRVLKSCPSLEIQTIEKLTVLFVTSRSTKRDDIPHRVVSLPLFSIVRQLDNRFVDVQLLRPGTWDAFRSAVKQGSYDMVHFDLHGVAIDQETGKRACLYFNDLAVAGEEIADLLHKNGVRLVTINACQSAFLHGDPGTNLATKLMGDSVEAVVAMSYQVTPAAAKIFLSSLYRGLLVEGQEMGTAVFNARRAMQASKQRDAAFGFPVLLHDYAVPLIYQVAGGGLYVRVPEKETSPEENTALETLFANRPALGREQQILSLEDKLIRRKVVVLTSLIGEGRATFLSHLKPWWIITKFVKRIFCIDFRHFPAFDLQGETPTAQAVCDRLLDFTWDANGITRPLGPTMDLLRKTRHLVVLEHTDCLTLSPPMSRTNLEAALKDFALDFFDDDFASFLLITSTSPESWANPTTPEGHRHKAGAQVLELDISGRMGVAMEILGWSEQTHRAGLEFRYLQRIVRLCCSNTLAMQALLPPLFASSSSARDAFWKLQISPAHLDWKSTSLASIGDRFDAAFNEFGEFLSVFLPIHVCCSRRYIQEHIGRNLSSLPWATESGSTVETRIDDAAIHLIARLCIYGAAQVSSPKLAATIQFHPLFCIYLRDRTTSSRLERSFRSIALYQHNIARRWASGASRQKMLDAYSYHYLAQFGALHFILQNPALIASDRRAFDLPWIMASVYCSQVRDPLLEEEELITDLALQALPRLVDGLTWTDNRSLNVLNIALLHGRYRSMSFQDCCLVLQLLQWITLHYFSLSKTTARHANSYIVLLLEGLRLVGESDPSSQLLRFIRSVSGLTAVEIGAADLDWAVMDYAPVYDALDDNNFQVGHSRLLFLQTWDQDLRFRLNWLQLRTQEAIRDWEQWEPAKYFPEMSKNERLDTLNDVLAFTQGIEYLEKKDKEGFDKARSTLLQVMLGCSEKCDTDRLLHTLYCLFLLSQKAKDWLACLEFLDRIEATELDLAAKPGFCNVDKEKYYAEAYRFRLRAQCHRGLGDCKKYKEYLWRSKRANFLADRLRTSWDRAQEYQQTERQRRLYEWVLNDEPTQNDQGGTNPPLFSRPQMVDVPVSSEELDECPDELAVRGAKTLGGSQPMRRMLANPQPPDPAYIQRSFLVEARWLTVTRYLDLVVGKEEEGRQSQLSEFRRQGTKFDLALYLESHLAQNLENDLRDNHGFDVQQMTESQLLRFLGLD